MDERLTREGEVVAEDLLDVAEVVQERVECLARDRQRLYDSVQVRPQLRATGVAELPELRVAHMALLSPPHRDVVVFFRLHAVKSLLLSAANRPGSSWPV